VQGGGMVEQYTWTGTLVVKRKWTISFGKPNH